MAIRATGNIAVEITVNNKVIKVPQEFKIGDLLKYLNYNRSVAIFINGKQLLMAEYQNYKIYDNDNIRIMKPLAGG